MKKLVGTVTNEEKCEIQTLFERRNGLNELAGILTVDNEVLYEKLVKDIGETGMKFQNWWVVCQVNINGKVPKMVIGRLILIQMKFI